jgi:hypothetical protein
MSDICLEGMTMRYGPLAVLENVLFCSGRPKLWRR